MSLKELKEWIKQRKRQDLLRRTPGLAEKMEAVERKMEVARLLGQERRTKDHPVEVERRESRPEGFNGTFKPA